MQTTSNSSSHRRTRALSSASIQNRSLERPLGWGSKLIGFWRLVAQYSRAPLRFRRGSGRCQPWRWCGVAGRIRALHPPRRTMQIVVIVPPSTCDATTAMPINALTTPLAQCLFIFFPGQRSSLALLAIISVPVAVRCVEYTITSYLAHKDSLTLLLT